MTPSWPRRAATLHDAFIAQAIAPLAREASVEVNVKDLHDLQASRALLPPGKRIYISHLPKQSWDDTLTACRRVSEAGFEPIPHVPVRLVRSEDELDRFLEHAVRHGRCNEVLLIAGDYREVAGPYASVAEVLQAGILARHGLRRVSFAGHPEGHHEVSVETIRRAEVDKAALAAAAGLDATFVTQFFFEAAPFLEWAAGSRAAGIRARLVAGLAGPASIATLFRFALRCGVGSSIRALGARPNSVMKLVGEHGPEEVMCHLAQARSDGQADFDGVHFFCFGGFLRTCAWLQDVGLGTIRSTERRGL